MRDVTEREGYTKMKMPKVQPVKIKLAKPFLKKSSEHSLSCTTLQLLTIILILAHHKQLQLFGN